LYINNTYLILLIRIFYTTGLYWVDKQSNIFRNPERIEFEPKIGHRKYNDWKVIEYLEERESKKIFIVPVEDRSEETFLACNGSCQEQQLFRIVGSPIIV